MTVAAEVSPIGEAADQKIKVAVRVRPLNKRGMCPFSLLCISYESHTVASKTNDSPTCHFPLQIRHKLDMAFCVVWFDKITAFERIRLALLSLSLQLKALFTFAIHFFRNRDKRERRPQL